MSNSHPSATRESAAHQPESGEHTRALRAMASKLFMAEVQERRRIAEDLHDHLGQYLALARMKLSVFRGNTMFCGHEQELEDIQNLLEQAIHYTRHMTKVVSPPVLYELGLVPALEWLTDQYSRRHNLEIRFSAEAPVPEFEEDIRGMIYRSVRELLLNVVKHAQAHRAELAIGFDGRDVEMVLTDDGRGFDPGAVSLTGGTRFGLFSVRERLTYLGGSLELESSPGNGARITMRCPINREPRE